MPEEVEKVCWVLGASMEQEVQGPWCKEASEWVLEEAWCAVGYFEEVQLTQLFSTENNLLICTLSQELLVLLLS